MKQFRFVGYKSRLFSLFGLILIGILLFNTVSPPSARADTAAIDTNLKKYLKLKAFDECLDGGVKWVGYPVAGPISVNINLDAGFSANIPRTSGTPFGYLYELPDFGPAPYIWAKSEKGVSVGHTVASDDGKWLCGTEGHADEWFKLIGYSGFKDFRDQNYEGDGDAQLKLKRDEGAVKADIRAKIKSSLPYSSPDDASLYINYVRSFKQCATRATNRNDIVGDPIDIKLYVELNGTKINDAMFQVKDDFQGTNADQVAIGHGLGASDGRLSCQTLGRKIEALAPAFADWFEKNKPEAAKLDAGGTTGTSDNQPTCESSGNPITWIMCPVFNGMGDFTDWMFRNLVEPLLRTPPVSTDPDNGSFQVWSNFRLYGNIILIISMLVIVFSQAIGGGMVDAYTAKKVMPRILVAAILVNLSIYIVSILVDVTNVLAGGIGQLMTAPFADAGQFKFTLDATQSIVIGAGSIVAFLSGIIFVVGFVGVGAAASFLALFVLLPAFVGVMGAFLTMVIRQGIILALIIVSPVAFALYCLPNTEKYFKKWWETLFKTLLVYPIVVVMFAVADILAVTIQKANGFGDGPLLDQAPAVTAAGSGIAGIVAFVAMFLPIALIPWAFKAAGGIVGSVVGAISGFGKKGTEAIKGNANDPNSLRNSTRRRVTGNVTKNRAQFVRSNKDSSSRLRRFAGRRMDFGNLMDKEAELNEDAQKRQGRTTGAGDDTYVRARTSLALYRRADGGETTDVRQAAIGADGKAMRVMKNGQAMRMSMNGQKRYTDYDYTKSTQLYRNMGEIQDAVNYEAKKALTDGDTDTLLGNYGAWMSQEGLTLEQGKGLFTGVAFARQGERLELKHASVESDGAGGFRISTATNNSGYTVNADGSLKQTGSQFNEKTGELQQLGGRDAFVQELFDKKGNWAVSQMHDSTINEVADAKEAYAADIRDLSSRDPATLSAVDASRLELSRSQLAKIQEMEESWVGDPQKTPRTGGASGTIDDEGTPGFSGLSGAATGVQAAARRMAHRTAVLEVADLEQDPGDPSRMRQKVDPATGKKLTTHTNATVRKKYDNNGQLVLYGNEVYGPPRP